MSALPGDTVPELTTADSVTTAHKDGTYSTRVFAQAVNYQDANGVWQPIDNTLVPAAGGFENRANRYLLAVPSVATTPVVVRRGGQWVSYGIAGATAAHVAVKGSTANFAGALPGTTVEYTAEGDAVKETTVLRGKRAAATVAFVVKASRGLRPRAARGGAVALVNGAGRAAFVLAPPFAQDAAKHVRPLRFRVTHVRGGWRFSVNVGRRWLRRALRRGPVVIDPTLHLPGANQDCYIDSGVPDTSKCGLSTLVVGSNGTSDHRGLLQFNVQNSIPTDSLVYNAKLGLYLESEQNTTSKSLGAYRVTKNWTTAATWNKADGANAWTAAGGDYDTSSNYASVNPTVGGSTGWNFWYPTRLTQDWVSGKVSNQGLVVKDTATVTNALSFTSSQSSITGQRPYLDVVWGPRAGNRGYYRWDTYRLNDRMQYKVNLGNGNGRLEASDENLPGIKMGVQVNRSYDSFFSNANWNLGAGMQSPMSDMWLDTTSLTDGSVKFYVGDGSIYSFIRNSDGSYQPPSDKTDAQLTKNADGTFKLVYQKTNKTLNFNTAGSLTSVKDQNNNTISLTQSSQDGLLSGITDEQNRTTSFARKTYPTKRIASFTDPASRTGTYNYDANNNYLQSYTDLAGHQTSYSYDGSGRLTQITDPNGQITKIAYNTNSQVTSLTRVTDNAAGTGPTTTYSYPAPDGTHCSGPDHVNQTNVTDPNGHTSYFCADARDAVKKETDADGNVRTRTFTNSGQTDTYTSAVNQGSSVNTSLTWDSGDNLTKSITGTGGTAAGISTSYTYGSSAFPHYPTMVQNPENQTQSYTYGGTAGGDYGNVTEVDDNNTPTARKNTIHHNSHGQVDYVIDAKIHKTTYGYSNDAFSRLTSITAPTVTSGTQMGATNLTYDSANRIQTVKDGKNQTRTYSYDNLDRQTNTAYTDSNNASQGAVGLGYDNDGNLTSRTDPANGGSSSSYSYDALNRTLQENLPGGKTNAYTYDAASNLKTFTDAGGTVTYNYDAANQPNGPDALVEPGGVQIGLHSDKNGDRTEEDLPGNIKVCTTYNKAKQVTDIKTISSATATCATTPLPTPIKSLKYNYNTWATDTEVPIDVTDQDGNKTSYGYDNLQRLTSAVTTNSGGTTTDNRAWTYDDAGNLKTKTINSPTATTYNYNEDNELTSDSTGRSYTYDANGNQLTKGSALTDVFNIRDQTTSINGTSQQFLGTSQAEQSTDGTAGLQNNGLGLGARTDATGTTYYTRDSTGNLIGERTPSGRYYYIQDRLGSVTALRDNTGTAANTYAYDPYGNTTSSTGTTLNVFGYAGAYKTAGPLWHFGQRYLDPDTTRWTQPDPIDQAGDLRNGNRYVYGGSNPTTHTDPKGLEYDYCGDGIGNTSGTQAGATYCEEDVARQASSLEGPDLLGIGGGCVAGAEATIEGGPWAMAGGCLLGAAADSAVEGATDAYDKSTRYRLVP